MKKHNFFKRIFLDIKKTRWNKTKPTMRTFGITLLTIIAMAGFVFLITWGITASLDAMRGN